jgi:hypothetical protein
MQPAIAAAAENWRRYALALGYSADAAGAWASESTAQHQRMATELLAMEHRNRLMQDARRIMEANMTPQETAIRQLSELNRLLASGALDAEQYQRAAARAIGEAQGRDQAHLAQGIQVGSQQAVQILNQALVGNQQDNDPQRQAAQLLAQVLEELRQTGALSRRANQLILAGQAFPQASNLRR